MSKKKINIKSTEDIRIASKMIDQWVNEGAFQPKEDFKRQTVEDNMDLTVQDVEPKGEDSIDDLCRLTIDLPKILHRRIKKQCAVDGISMRECVTNILIKAFPEK